MSLTMGFGGIQNEKTIEYEDRFYDLCRRKSKPIADYRISIAEAERVIKKGCRIMVYSADLIYTSEKFKELMAQIDTHLRML